MTLYGGLIEHSTDTFFRTLLLDKSIYITIYINGNISYDVILKHQKFIRCEFVCRVLFTVNHDEDFPVNNFQSIHITLSMIIVYHLTFS